MNKLLSIVSMIVATISILMGCSSSELTESEKTEINLDIRQGTSKLMGVAGDFIQGKSKLTSKEEMDTVLSDYYDDPLLSELRNTWYDQLLTGRFEDKNLSGTVMEFLPLNTKEEPRYTVVENGKVLAVWDKVERFSEPNKFVKLEVTVVKKEDKWKISYLTITE